MKNKSVQKFSNRIKFSKLLKKKLRMMIVNKSLYSSMTTFLSFRNLVHVTLKECKFNFLPKEFNTLHSLQHLNILENLALDRTQSAWERLEQISVKSNIELLENNSEYISFLLIVYNNNFTNLFISWSKIDFLPGINNSSLIIYLDLKLNNLEKCGQFIWEWLMQAPIRNNLVGLNLSNNNLTKLPIQIINNIKNLHVLCLSDNKFKFLPKEFGNLSQLKELDLSRNLLGKGGHTTSIWYWLENPIKDSLLQLDLHGNLLTEFPLQITYITNLRWLDVSDNKIKFLPKELGNLPYLTYLNLANNCLEESEYNTWEWLEQATIRYKLSKLDLSQNRLTRLPSQIGMLHALTILYLYGNKLECLPHTLIHLTNLQMLQLNDNNLLYLPGSLTGLSTSINVEMNPFNLEDNNDDFTTKLDVPCLMECSAEIILRSKLYYLGILPKALVRYMKYEKYYCFFCDAPCFFYYGKRFIRYSDYEEIVPIEFDATLNIRNASFECYACSPVCARKLWD